MAREKYSSRALTNKLREIMASVHTTNLVDGEMTFVAKGERLAEILADRAHGWTEIELIEGEVHGQITEKKTWHKPERWAIEMAWERM